MEKDSRPQRDPSTLEKMTSSISQLSRYQVSFRSGAHSGLADVPAEYGGTDAGFRPHDLLEAALGTCISMTVQMYADRRAIPLRSVDTRVTVHHGEAETLFDCEIRLEGDITPEQRTRLLEIADKCPVRRSLSKPIRFAKTIAEGAEGGA